MIYSFKTFFKIEEIIKYFFFHSDSNTKQKYRYFTIKIGNLLYIIFFNKMKNIKIVYFQLNKLKKF